MQIRNIELKQQIIQLQQTIDDNNEDVRISIESYQASIIEFKKEFEALKQTTKLLSGANEINKKAAGELWQKNQELEKQSKQLAEALEKNWYELYSLMNFCIEQKIIDEEEETIGLINFNKAIKLADEALTNYKQIKR